MLNDLIPYTLILGRLFVHNYSKSDLSWLFVLERCHTLRYQLHRTHGHNLELDCVTIVRALCEDTLFLDRGREGLILILSFNTQRLSERSSVAPSQQWAQ